METNTAYEAAMNRLGNVLDMIDIHTGKCYSCVGGVECERLERLESQRAAEEKAVIQTVNSER